jgi:hypothetical protein
MSINNQTNAKVNDPLELFVNQLVNRGSSGSIELKKNSKHGELIESFDINSPRVLINGRKIVVNPTNPLPYETVVYMTVTDGFVVSRQNGSLLKGWSNYGSKEFKITTEDAIGKELSGGKVISKENSWYVVISSHFNEKTLTWHERGNVLTEMENLTGESGWYIPDYYELLNYTNHLDREKIYWTNSESSSGEALILNIDKGIPYSVPMTQNHVVRAFKKVYF